MFQFLTVNAIKILIIPIFALLFRLRGGLFGDFIHKYWSAWGSTWARIFFWGTGSGLACWWLTGRWQIAGLIAVTFYIDSTLGWYGSLGIVDNTTVRIVYGKNYLILALRGLVWVLPGAIIMGFFHYSPWFFLLSLLCPICYQIAFYTTLINNPKGGNIIPVGEALFGGIIGIAFYLSYLHAWSW